MGSIRTSSGLCSVCKEALIEKVHNLVSPINSFTPANTAPLTASSSLVFNLNLTTPNPNTMRVIWELVDENNDVITLETDYNAAPDANATLGGTSGTAGGAPSGFNRWNMDCAAFAGKPAGNYTIRARVYDMTGTAEDAVNRWVRHPQHMIDANDAENGNHERKVEWTVYYSGNPGVDLVIEDSDLDIGLEPNGIHPNWESQAIWVRNNPLDNGTEHENPQYVAATPVQVNAWVKNVGCRVYTATDAAQLNFYWTKAGTEFNWPTSFYGNEYFTETPQPVKGGVIGTVTITQTIDAVDENPTRVATNNWQVPDPADYSFATLNDMNHFCLLARLITANSLENAATPNGMQNEQTGNMVYFNVRNNNNIAQKNFTILNGETFASSVGDNNADDRITGAAVFINNQGAARSVNIKFEVPTNETGKPITEEAEVRIVLSDTLWQRWVNGGQLSTNVQVYNASRKQLLLTNSAASISNILFDAASYEPMYVGVNFLTEERSAKETFTFRVIHTLNDSALTVLGGETYTIQPDPNRASFAANAGGDKEILIGSNYQLIARGIVASAIHNWYDVATGNKIYTGDTYNATANNTGTQTLKLETIAQSDGYKDYDVVNVTTILGKINSVAPNPANSGTFTINYSVANAVNVAKIKVININTNSFTENTISTGNGSLSLNVTNYATGSHSIVLICDGQTADSELFVVQ